MNREFKGVWIPAEIYLNKDLSMTEKILLTEIDSLSRLDAGCFAQNYHFAAFLGISQKTVANLLTRLSDCGFLAIEGRGLDRSIRLVTDAFSRNREFDLSRNREIEIPKSGNPHTPYKDISTLIKTPNNKGTRISTDFKPSVENLKWASERFPELDLDLETEKFKNYWLSLSGQRAVKRDWQLTWKNWMINASDYKENDNVRRFRTDKPTAEDAVRQTIALIRSKS